MTSYDICTYISICVTIVPRRGLNSQLPYIVGKSKICVTVKNEKTKFRYLKFHALRNPQS